MRAVSHLLIAGLALAAAPAGAEDALRNVTGQAVIRERIALPEMMMLVAEARGLRDALLAETRGPAGAVTDFALEVPQGAAARVAVAVSPMSSLASSYWLSEGNEVAAGAEDVDLGMLPVISRQPMGFAVSLICGDRPVQVGIRLLDGDESPGMALRVDGEDFILGPSVEAEEGGLISRAADDETTWFHDKGEISRLSLRGEEVDCEAAAPVAYEAAGEDWRVRVVGTAEGFERGGAWGLIRGDDAPAGSFAPARWRDGAVVWEDPDGDAALRMSPGLCAVAGVQYPETAELTLGEETLAGCGGDRAELLTGAEWVVEDIAGGGIIDSSRVTLNFGADGRANGAASCNRWMGGYALEQGGLQFAQAAATMMACPPALMAQERKFLDALAATAGFAIDDTGALILQDADGAALLTARR